MLSCFAVIFLNILSSFVYLLFVFCSLLGFSLYPYVYVINTYFLQSHVLSLSHTWKSINNCSVRLLWSSWNCSLPLCSASSLEWEVSSAGPLGSVCPTAGGSTGGCHTLCLEENNCHIWREQEQVSVEITNLQWSEERSRGGEEMKPADLPLRLLRKASQGLPCGQDQGICPRLTVWTQRTAVLSAFSQRVAWSARHLASILGRHFSCVWAELQQWQGRLGVHLV